MMFSEQEVTQICLRVLYYYQLHVAPDELDAGNCPAEYAKITVALDKLVACDGEDCMYDMLKEGDGIDWRGMMDTASYCHIARLIQRELLTKK